VENLANTEIRYQDRRASSESLYQLSFPGPLSNLNIRYKINTEIHVDSWVLQRPELWDLPKLRAQSEDRGVRVSSFLLRVWEFPISKVIPDKIFNLEVSGQKMNIVSDIRT